MKESTNRPRFNFVTAFIAQLRIAAMRAKHDLDKEVDPAADKKEFRYAGLGARFGAPIYQPKRTKFKGYMRDESYKAKRS